MKAGNHFGRVETDPMAPNQLGKYTTRRKDRVVPLAKMSAGLLSVHYGPCAAIHRASQMLLAEMKLSARHY